MLTVSITVKYIKVLGGQHAFEYSITVISITGRIVVTNFKNGKEARKGFYKYKRKK